MRQGFVNTVIVIALLVLGLSSEGVSAETLTYQVSTAPTASNPIVITWQAGQTVTLAQADCPDTMTCYLTVTPRHDPTGLAIGGSVVLQVGDYATGPPLTRYGTATFGGTGTPSPPFLTGLVLVQDPPSTTPTYPVYCNDGHTSFFNCVQIEGNCDRSNAWCGNGGGRIAVTRPFHATNYGTITFTAAGDWGMYSPPIRTHLGNTRLRVNWGDGSTLTDLSGPTASHVYATPGAKTVRVELNEDFHWDSGSRSCNYRCLDVQFATIQVLP